MRWSHERLDFMARGGWSSVRHLSIHNKVIIWMIEHFALYEPLIIFHRETPNLFMYVWQLSFISVNSIASGSTVGRRFFIDRWKKWQKSQRQAWNNSISFFLHFHRCCQTRKFTEGWKWNSIFLLFLACKTYPPCFVKLHLSQPLVVFHTTNPPINWNSPDYAPLDIIIIPSDWNHGLNP